MPRDTNEARLGAAKLPLPYCLRHMCPATHMKRAPIFLGRFPLTCILHTYPGHCFPVGKTTGHGNPVCGAQRGWQVGREGVAQVTCEAHSQNSPHGPCCTWSSSGSSRCYRRTKIEARVSINSPPLTPAFQEALRNVRQPTSPRDTRAQGTWCWDSRPPCACVKGEKRLKGPAHAAGFTATSLLLREGMPLPAAANSLRQLLPGPP